MHFLDRAADRVAQGLALIGALGVMALLIHVALDVTLRNLFDRPIPATNEIASRYYMVLIAFLPLAWVERSNSMVSVEVLDEVLPKSAIRLSDILVALIATVIYGTIAWVCWLEAVDAWSAGSFVDVLGHKVAVWPTYFLPPAGFGLAALVTLLRGARKLTGAA